MAKIKQRINRKIRTLNTSKIKLQFI